MRAVIAGFMVLCALAVLAPGQAKAGDLDDLDKALGPGNAALARVIPDLDALADPLSRDVLNGKADLHVFYGMVMARLLTDQCMDTLALMRSAQAQECPALQAALAKRLANEATQLEGAAGIIAGSLAMTSRAKVGLLGRATLGALEMFLPPLKEFAAAHQGGEL